jgi:hypothetical protein
MPDFVELHRQRHLASTLRTAVALGRVPPGEMFCGDRPCPRRRASVGLTFEARQAGMKAAARAPATRSIAAAEERREIAEKQENLVDSGGKENEL